MKNKGLMEYIGEYIVAAFIGIFILVVMIIPGILVLTTKNFWFFTGMPFSVAIGLGIVEYINERF